MPLSRHGERILEDKVYDKHMKPINCTPLPDSLKTLRTFRLVKKLTRYFRSGFIKYIQGNYEGYHNNFLLKHETRHKNTERHDVSYQASIFKLREFMIN